MIQFKNMIKVISLSITGAIAGYILKLPMGILVGSFLVIAIAQISGLAVPPLQRRYKQKIQMVIGGLVGLNLQPDVAALFLKLIVPGLIATIGHILFAFLLAKLFTKLLGFNWLTAITGSIPAGMSEISNLVDEIEVDEQIVMLMHLFRVSLIILILPVFIKILL